MTIDDTTSGEDLRASRFLSLFREGRPRRAVDQLIDHLELAGTGALQALLETGPGAPLARHEGPVPLALAREVVERSKQATAASADEHLRCMAAYFAALAAGLGFHGVLLTSRPRRDLDPILVDLAAVTDGGLQELFLLALRRGHAGN